MAENGGVLPASGGDIDLHELAKGWRAAITRAKDPATRYDLLRLSVVSIEIVDHDVSVSKCIG